MLKNYLKIAFRNIFRGKLYTAINITGLIIGLTSFIFIMLYVQNQYSYDSFNKKADRIYRLDKINTPNLGTEEKHAISSGMMGPTMVKDFPEVEQSVRVLPWFSSLLFKYDQKELKIPDVVFADSNFFDVFDYKLLEGDSKTALVNPMSVVISKDVAQQFFGNENPVGKIIYDSDNSPFKITGIIENCPFNSHLKYSVLVSWSTTMRGSANWNLPWVNNWLTQVEFTYLLLKPNTSYKALEVKFPALIKEHLPNKVEQYHLYLQPLTDIYLGSSDLLYTRGTRIGNKSYVNIFIISAILILLIASFNFMNLTSARALKKAKEVGVRKTFGAQKTQIIKQFLVESVIVTFIAIAFSLILIEVLMPVFYKVTGVVLNIDYTELILLVMALTVLVGVLSGIYPAILLSRLNSITVMRGIEVSTKGKNIPRKISVGVQFIISAFLITCTIVIYSQMKYVQNKNLGFNPDQVIVLNTSGTKITGNFKSFENELMRNPDIISTSASSTVPGKSMIGYKIEPEGKPENVDYTTQTIAVGDDNFANTYDLEMKKGRFFSKNYPSDETNAVVINQTLANELDWTNPVGKRIDVKGEVKDGKVIGVVKDFHMNSLHHKIEPVLFYYKSRSGFISLKVKAGNLSSTLSYIEQTWKKFDAEYPFDYEFLNKSFEELYQSDVEMMNIFSLFSGFAIFVACLGLFGLITYSSERRRKEIGIRKVLGANVSGIVLLLSKEFLIIVIISTLISWPITYYLMNNWLQDFAYRISLNVWMFIIAGVTSFILAFVTMGYQAIKAAYANPTKSLRYE